MDQLFFVVSKLGGPLLRPDAWIIALIFLGVVLRSRRVLGALLASLVVLAIFPIGSFVLSLHERGVAVSSLPKGASGIVILGGAEDTRLSLFHDQIQLKQGAERLVIGAQLATATGLPVLVTGGHVSLSGQGPSGAAVMAEALVDLGVSERQILQETRARTTWENAQFSFDLLQPSDTDRWILVTSAFHMRRAQAAFEAAGWHVLPYPVDYRAWPVEWSPRWDLVRQLEHATIALRETAGLLAYRWSGRG